MPDDDAAQDTTNLAALDAAVFLARTSGFEPLPVDPADGDDPDQRAYRWAVNYADAEGLVWVVLLFSADRQMVEWTETYLGERDNTPGLVALADWAVDRLQRGDFLFVRLHALIWNPDAPDVAAHREELVGRMARVAQARETLGTAGLLLPEPQRGE